MNKFENTLPKLEYAREQIKEQLKDYPNLVKVNFNEISGGKYVIVGNHKLVKNYYYGEQIIIKHNLINIEDAIHKFVEQWKECDTLENLNSYKEFIADGEKWGWD